MTVEGTAAVPLWLLYEDEIDAWRATMSAQVANWLAEQDFKAEKHRLMLMPDPAGAVGLAVGGLGKRQGELSLWHAAGLAERLPPRRFRLAQDWNASEATQLCLGFAYGAYRFERYRPLKAERAATLEPPANADLRFVALAGEALKITEAGLSMKAEIEKSREQVQNLE